MSRFIIDEVNRGINKSTFRLMSEFLTEDEKKEILEENAKKRAEMTEIKAKLQLLYEKFLAGEIQLNENEVLNKTLEFTFQGMMDVIDDMQDISNLAEKIGAN